MLLGASGLVGAACLARLLESDRYARVIAPVRRSTRLAHPRLEERVIDFASPPELERASVDDVYCALGTTMKKAGSKEAFREVDYAIPLRMAERARAAGARSFALVSSVGADARAASFYLRTKGELEDALEGLGFDALVILRPSLLLGDRAEDRAGERFGIALGRAVTGLLIGPLRKYRPIQADQVAAAMIAAVGEQTKGSSPVRTFEHDAIMELARRS